MRPIFIVFGAFQHNPICAFERREDAIAQIDKLHEKNPDVLYYFRGTTLIWNVPDCLYTSSEAANAVSEG